MKKFSFLFALAICFLHLGCKSNAQNGRAQNSTPKELIDAYLKPNWNLNGAKSNLFPADSKFKKSKDHTEIVQKIIDENKIIVLPDFKLYINSKGLKIGSNKTIIFQENSSISFIGEANGRFSDVIKIYDAENVRLVNPVVVGSRYSKTKSQTGQWSAGICVLNSKEVKITNANISSTFGDGIFIGSENGGFSQNVTVEGGYINKARRNGISVTSAKNIVLKDILIANTYGHDPESGIDLEPSWEKDILTDIQLKNIYTYHNNLAGISVNLNAFNKQSKQDIKTVRIHIENHTDDGSKHGFLTSLNTEDALYDANGLIKIQNVVWKNNEKPYWFTKNNHNIELIFYDIKIDDSAQKKSFEESVKGIRNIKMITE